MKKKKSGNLCIEKKHKFFKNQNTTKSGKVFVINMTKPGVNFLKQTGTND